MEIVTKVKERFEKRGIKVAIFTSIDPEMNLERKGLRFIMNDYNDIIVYSEDTFTEQEYFKLCRETLSKKVENVYNLIPYTAEEVINYSFLAVDNHCPFNEEHYLCRRFLNLDVLVYVEISEGHSEPLSRCDLEYLSFDEDTIWTAAYHNTEIRTFIEQPQDWQSSSYELGFESCYEDYAAVGILYKNLLWNFCNEKGVGYCFIVPESRGNMRLIEPQYLKNGKLMKPKKQANKLLKALKEIAADEDTLLANEPYPLDHVIYIYDKLLNHIEIIAK